MRTLEPGPPSWVAGSSPVSILRRMVIVDTPSSSAASRMLRYSLSCTAVVIDQVYATVDLNLRSSPRCAGPATPNPE
jgi:hypothetical protein